MWAIKKLGGNPYPAYNEPLQIRTEYVRPMTFEANYIADINMTADEREIVRSLLIKKLVEEVDRHNAVRIKESNTGNGYFAKMLIASIRVLPFAEGEE